MRRSGALGLALAMGAALLSPLATAHAAETHDVEIRNNEFRPRSLEIELGDTVRWRALAGGHTVTALDGTFDFRPQFGEEVSHTFPVNDEPRFVRYFCQVHPSMTGVIQVGEPPAEPVPPAPEIVVPDDVPTLRAAAAGAQPGTHVLVRPGTYEEEVVVSVPGLVIRGLGDGPGKVVLHGRYRPNRVIGIRVQADGVRIENLTVTGYRHTGIQVHDVTGVTIEDVAVDHNDLFGLDVRPGAPSGGVSVRRVVATRHGVAGVAVRDCRACGARVEDAVFERNAAGILVVDATGVTVRRSHLRGNGVGVVLRSSPGAHVTGNTLVDNSATNIRVSSPSDGAELPTGAGVWISGGSSSLVASNTLSGHTYNVAVTGPTPPMHHTVRDNIVYDARNADLGWDGLGAGVCFSGNHQPGSAAPTSDPPSAQTLYPCGPLSSPGIPYPVVTANLASHAARVG